MSNLTNGLPPWSYAASIDAVLAGDHQRTGALLGWSGAGAMLRCASKERLSPDQRRQLVLGLRRALDTLTSSHLAASAHDYAESIHENLSRVEASRTPLQLVGGTPAALSPSPTWAEPLAAAICTRENLDCAVAALRRAMIDGEPLDDGPLDRVFDTIDTIERLCVNIDLRGDEIVGRLYESGVSTVLNWHAGESTFARLTATMGHDDAAWWRFAFELFREGDVVAREPDATAAVATVVVGRWLEVANNSLGSLRLVASSHADEVDDVVDDGPPWSAPFDGGVVRMTRVDREPDAADEWCIEVSAPGSGASWAIVEVVTTDSARDLRISLDEFGYGREPFPDDLLQRKTSIARVHLEVENE